MTKAKKLMQYVALLGEDMAEFQMELYKATGRNMAEHMEQKRKWCTFSEYVASAFIWKDSNFGCKHWKDVSKREIRAKISRFSNVTI